MNRSSRRRLAVYPFLEAFLFALALSSPGCTAAAAPAREPVVGLPCEGCEAIFAGMPEEPAAAARIGPLGELGEPLRIVGTVFDPSGKPAPGIVVYAYQTDAAGHYPPDEARRGQPGARHGRLRAWVRTDGHGEYAFDTIRPGRLSRHGHPAARPHARPRAGALHLLHRRRPVRRRSAPHRREARELRTGGRGGSGIAAPTKGSDGVWNVRRDIRLGEKIPGYPPAR